MAQTAEPVQQPPILDKARHLKYWTRCLQTPLPHQYASNDSNRLVLAFFILSAIDLLTSPQRAPSTATAESGQAPVSGDKHGSSPAAPHQAHVASPHTAAALLSMRAWVLSLLHPSGCGFCGSPTMQPAPPSRPIHAQSQARAHKGARGDYDGDDGQPPLDVACANLAATFFGLLLLALTAPTIEAARTAFQPLNRRAILLWLRRLQRPDGSFGEVVVSRDPDNTTIAASESVAGGRDMRYLYLAAAIRWCLRDEENDGGPTDGVDIDKDKLVAYIRQGQTFDGGIAESSSHESHAGYAYCAVAALELLDRPPEYVGRATTFKVDDHGNSATNRSVAGKESAMRRGIPDPGALVRFCMARQFAYLVPGEYDTRQSRSQSQHHKISEQARKTTRKSGEGEGDGDDDEDASDYDNFHIPASLHSLTYPCNLTHLAFNGRCNKMADTCYTWWTTATLVMLLNARPSVMEHAGPAITATVFDPSAEASSQSQTINVKEDGPVNMITHTTALMQPSAVAAARKFLLDETQHIIGGFAKHPDGPPDIYHSYLGLAALAMLEESESSCLLPAFDPALCISELTLTKLVAAREGMLQRERQAGNSMASKKEDEQTVMDNVQPQIPVSFLDLAQRMVESNEAARTERPKREVWG